uniref:Gamma carbonic anhydrase family protein n=1 Tax=Spongospora subterranea TaxID=70186 RepID=A0A0H5QIK1_9EUKA|eukprot:CRZ01146.1 hypothetical protein [Spongospora subterranea]
MRRLGRRLSTVVSPSAWIAPSATVEGSVRLEAHSSVWYNTVIRGNVTIGCDSNVQDGSVVVGDGNKPTEIGSGVTIGHAARLHSCKIGDRCLVGIGSIITNAEMQAGSQLGAGAVLQPGALVQTGQIWAGNPAKYHRDLTSAETAFLEQSAKIYVQNAEMHRAELGNK